MFKVYADEQVHADVQACNIDVLDNPDDCSPYLYEGTIVNDYMTINRTARCLEEQNIEDLLGWGINDIRLVDHSEDWFTRIQYHIDY